MNDTELQNVRRIQEKLLEILLYFQEFCEAHGLSFTLAGGTLLGAARNGGFVPWDDDADVFMLREDYEKLGPLWEQYADRDRYTYLRSDEKINIRHAAAEIRDNHTTFITRHNADLDIHQGLMLDVIPLDDVGHSKARRCAQMAASMVYCCFNFQRLPEHKGKLTVAATRAGLALVQDPKTRYRIWKGAERDVIRLGDKDSGLVASFGEGATIMRQRFPRKWFENPVYLDFEGHPMPCPADYDRWLTVSYGNYMEFPPEEEQVARHDIVFMDLERPYTEYRGIYYCTDRT